MNKIFKKSFLYLIGIYITFFSFNINTYASGLYKININPNNGDYAYNIIVNNDNDEINVYSKLDEESENYANITNVGLEIPVRNGYVFSGYYASGYSTPLIESDGTVSEEAMLDYLSDTDEKKFTLEAKWIKLKFQINLVANKKVFRKIYFANLNNEVVYSIDSTQIYSIDVPKSTNKKLVFAGYYIGNTKVIDDEGNIIIKNGVALVKKAIKNKLSATLEAKWKDKPVKSTTTKSSDDDTTENNETKSEDENETSDSSDNDSGYYGSGGSLEDSDTTDDELLDNVNDDINKIYDDANVELPDNTSDVTNQSYDDNNSLTYSDTNGNEDENAVEPASDNSELTSEETENATTTESTEEDETSTTSESETSEIICGSGQGKYEEESEQLDSDGNPITETKCKVCSNIDEDGYCEDDSEDDSEDTEDEEEDNESDEEDDESSITCQAGEGLYSVSTGKLDEDGEEIEEEKCKKCNNIDEDGYCVDGEEEVKKAYILCYLKDNNVKVGKTKKIKYKLSSDLKGYKVTIKKLKNDKVVKFSKNKKKFTGKKKGTAKVKIIAKKGKKKHSQVCQLMVYKKSLTKSQKSVIESDTSLNNFRKNNYDADTSKIVKNSKSNKKTNISCGTNTVKVNKSLSLNYSITPKTTSQSVKITSSSKKIKITKKSGINVKVKGLKKGKATVKIQSNENKKLTKNCKVTISNNTKTSEKTSTNKKKKTLTDFSISTTSVKVKKGKSQKITISYNPKTAVKTKSINSSNTKIASVKNKKTNSFEIKGKKKGTTNVTVKVTDKSGKVTTKNISVSVTKK